MEFMKITIVDDEEDICYILRLELSSLGHEVNTFPSAVAAQQYLMHDTPDAILCDFQMPMLSGLDLFQWLKTQDRNISFYLLTGEPIMDKTHLINQGITDVLYKPQDLLRLSTIFK